MRVEKRANVWAALINSVRCVPRCAGRSIRRVYGDKGKQALCNVPARIRERKSDFATQLNPTVFCRLSDDLVNVLVLNLNALPVLLLLFSFLFFFFFSNVPYILFSHPSLLLISSSSFCSCSSPVFYFILFFFYTSHTMLSPSL